MSVIEADGVETDPVDVDELVIYAGQRYSVVVEANQTVGNYCMPFFLKNLVGELTLSTY